MSQRFVLDKFKIRPAQACFTGLVRDVLYYNNVDITEELLCGLCSGWLFRFGYKNGDLYKSEASLPNDSMIIEDGVFDFSLFHNVMKTAFGYEVNEIFTDDVEEIWDVIINTLKTGNIPLVAIHVENLEYFPQTLRTQHGHFVAVYGYDLEKSTVYIGDVLIPSVPRSIYQGEVSLKNFLEAIKLRIEGIKIKVGVWVLKKSKPYTGVSAQFYEEALYRIIEQNNNKTISYFEQGFINCGIYAIEKFYNDLIYFSSGNDTDILFNSTEALYSGIISRGGPAPARKQMAEFILNSQNIMNINCNGIIDNLTILSKEFSILASVFIRLGFTKNLIYCDKAISIVNKIVSLEKETLKMLGASV